MKKFVAYMMTAVVLMTIGCQDKDEIPIEEVPAQYIRTDGYVESGRYPVTTVISSQNDLEQYCELYQDTYNLTKFREAINVYSNEFFADNFLIIVMLQEGSGSIRHRVKRIESNGDIVICRLLPYLLTADMAAWNIIIEVNNDYGIGQFQVRLMDKPL